MSSLIHSMPFILNGLLYTILMAVLSLALGFVIGSLLGLGRFYGNRVINGIAVIYSRIMRSIPTILNSPQLFLKRLIRYLIM